MNEHVALNTYYPIASEDRAKAVTPKHHEARAQWTAELYTALVEYRRLP